MGREPSERRKGKEGEREEEGQGRKGEHGNFQERKEAAVVKKGGGGVKQRQIMQDLMGFILKTKEAAGERG